MLRSLVAPEAAEPGLKDQEFSSPTVTTAIVESRLHVKDHVAGRTCTNGLERLDDFRGEVNRRLDEVNLELRTQRAEMRAAFTEVNRRFEDVNGRFDALNQTMTRFGFGAVVTFVVGFAGMIATQL